MQCYLDLVESINLQLNPIHVGFLGGYEGGSLEPGYQYYHFKKKLNKLSINSQEFISLAKSRSIL